MRSHSARPAAAHILGKGGSLIRAGACRCECEGIFIMPLPLFVCTFHTSGGGHLSSVAARAHGMHMEIRILTLFIDARRGGHLTWSTFRRMVDTTPVVLLQSFNRGNNALAAETNQIKNLKKTHRYLLRIITLWIIISTAQKSWRTSIENNFNYLNDLLDSPLSFERYY